MALMPYFEKRMASCALPPYAVDHAAAVRCGAAGKRLPSRESAPSPRLSTQASNFSFFNRSAAFAVTTTVSMPNCRKPSASSARAGFIQTYESGAGDGFSFDGECRGEGKSRKLDP